MTNTSINSGSGDDREISQKLCTFLRENILAPEVDVLPSTVLQSIGIDSFSLMELILFIERSYGLILPPDSLTPENIATVNALSICCAKQLNCSEN